MGINHLSGHTDTFSCVEKELRYLECHPTFFEAVSGLCVNVVPRRKVENARDWLLLGAPKRAQF